uniref:ATPase Na+/K+ transporting subunit beta 1 n=1 Tax=Hucho hucho TaxID=62062 RepID=A0A4W5KM69_9TELE
MSANKDGDGGWKRFLWNSERKEFLGRTGGSWFKILLFYLIFYGCLAGIFIGTIQALLLTLSNYKPTYQDRVAPPGLSHTPRSEKFEISYNINDVETYLKYTKSIKDFLEMYDDERQTDQIKYEDCGGKYRLVETSRHYQYLVPNGSIFPLYKSVKNKFLFYYDGLPRPNPPLTRTTLGQFLLTVMSSCHSLQREEDASKIGEIKYYGMGMGFPLQYYPYYGKLLQPQYLQPLVAIQFTNLTFNEELRLECKVYGANIDYSEKDRYQGRFDVKFTIASS